MEEFSASIVAEAAVETAKHLFKYIIRGKFSFLIPDYFKYPIVPGAYHQNPIALKEGFAFHVANNSKSPIMLSFFVLKAHWKRDSKQFSATLDPKYYLKAIDALATKGTWKVTLPWKPVVLSCLYAGYIKEVKKADFFHIRMNAYDDYAHSFYESERLSEFFIRSHALWHIPELWDSITDEELEKVGWRREGTRWVNTALYKPNIE
jgi:hypothetical protein